MRTSVLRAVLLLCHAACLGGRSAHGSLPVMDVRLQILLHRHNLTHAVPLLEGRGVHDFERLSLLSHDDVDEMIQVFISLSFGMPKMLD